MTEPSELRFGLEVSSAWNVTDGRTLDARACFERVVRQTEVARSSGWDGIFTGQYFVRHPIPLLQPWPLLANLANRTGTMDLGTGIALLPLLHPIDVAEQVATIDALADGRFILGVGAAYGDEIEHFGIDRPSRGRRVEEMIHIIRALWRGDPFDFAGEFFHLAGIRPTLLPSKQPAPEIWLAANADAAVRRAGRIADSWFANPHANLATLTRQRDLFLEHFSASGRGDRPQWLPLMREVMVADTNERAHELIRPYLVGQYQDVYIAHGQDKAMPSGDNRFDLPLDELSRQRFVIGDPDTVAAELAEYIAAGFNYQVLQVPWSGVGDDDLDAAIDLLGREVFPRVRTLVR